jgi:hypothetical protein
VLLKYLKVKSLLYAELHRQDHHAFIKYSWGVVRTSSTLCLLLLLLLLLLLYASFVGSNTTNTTTAESSGGVHLCP